MPTQIKDSTQHAFERIERLYKRQHAKGGHSTGYKSIDAVLGGLHTGDLIVLAGFPNNLKSTLALQILIYNLLLEYKPTLLVSPTLSTLQITNRLLSLISRIPLDKISGGMLVDPDFPRLTKAVDMLERSKLVISDYRDRTDSKDEFFNSLRDSIVKDQIKILFIDPMPFDAREEGEDYADALKELARDLKITIFLITDIPASTTDVLKPSYSHLKPLGNIEDYADAICLIHKETVHDPLENGDKEVNVITLTNYARSCRLFVDDDTRSFVEEREDKFTYIGSIGKGS